MCRPAAPAPTAARAPSAPSDIAYFDESTKCCTYQPQLANFLVGAMLEDDSAGFAAGRASVERRIDARDGVSPLGLARPWAYDLLYREATRSAEGFGRTPSLRCPHYAEERGGCTIWAYREAVCATWFCRHDRGALGREFWSAVKATLRAAEHALARHCVLETGLGAGALRRAFPTSPEVESPPPPDPAAYALGWGDWVDRERAFYRASWAIARAVPWSELCALGGVELKAQLVLLTAAHARVQSHEVPRRLRARALHVLPQAGGSCRVSTYRAYDPIELPTALIDSLHRFDGRPVVEVLAEMRREDGVTVDGALLQRLVDFEVLGESRET